MPDQGRVRVYRFRDHVVAGVNWRPTRFVDEVPNSRVCSLCGIIPKRTVLLPCSHALCQSCHTASSEGGVGRCPLDQEPFAEAECVGYELPSRKANTFKVYCWNHAHGCENTGTMDRMLEHYENECKFHVVECLRCGEGVQHSDLPTHYVAGCTAAVSSAITEFMSVEPTGLNLEDLGAALEDLKAMLGDPNHDQLLPVIQSQLNELTEQARKQDARFAEITREVGASESNLKSQMAQIATTITSTVSQQLNSRQDPAEEPTTSSLSWRSEKELILRKLEHLADQSRNVPEDLRQNSPQPDSSHVIAYCKRWNDDIRHFTSALSTTPARIKAIGPVYFFVFLENCDEIVQYNGTRKKFADVTMWHMRDTYFTFAVWKYGGDVTVEIKFYGLLADSRCSPPWWYVTVSDSYGGKGHSLHLVQHACDCKCHESSSIHFHFSINVDINSLKKDGFLRDRKMRFQITLDNVHERNDVRGVAPCFPCY